MKRFSLFLITGLLLMGFGLSLKTDVPTTRAAFGTSPPWIRNDHLLPGSTFEQVVNLSRNNPDRDMQVTFRVDGDEEIEKWLNIEDEKNLVMKAGQKVLPVKFIVKVPRRAALKDYREGIFTTLEPLEADQNQQGGSVAIKLGAHILVELSVVGEKVTDYRVKSISLEPLNQGEPFYFNVELENLGNTEIAALDGQIDIYDHSETEVLKSLTFGELTNPISPDEKVLSRVEFEDLVLDPGEYWVRVKVLKEGETIYENRLFQRVLPEVVPVVTPEAAEVSRPSIPQRPDELESALLDAQPDSVREAAPESGSETRLIVLLGIGGFIFGLVALVAVIILLVILIRRQRQATLQRYMNKS